jgi:hypothetical protein
MGLESRRRLPAARGHRPAARPSGLRLLFGMLQMFGAVAGLTLLLTTGLSAATLLTALATTALSLTSRRLWGGRSSFRQSR